jgi:hypothetical protein
VSGPPGLSGEIPGAGVDADGAVAPRVGSDRGARPRPGRHRPGGAGDRYFDVDDRSRARRTAIARPHAGGTGAAAGWGPETDDRQGPHAAARSGGAGRADDLGAPDSPLRWTAKSTRTLAQTLQSMGHRVSHQLVRELLSAAGYSLQANRKTREGPPHPDRDAQFRHITAQVRQFQAAGQPVISVDTKKKELVGDFKNAGRAWRPMGQPEAVAGLRTRTSPSSTDGRGRVLTGFPSLRPTWSGSRAGGAFDPEIGVLVRRRFCGLPIDADECGP